MRVHFVVGFYFESVVLEFAAKDMTKCWELYEAFSRIFVVICCSQFGENLFIFIFSDYIMLPVFEILMITLNRI